MNAFELYNPVRVFFGEGQLSHLSEQIPADARVLLTFGGGSIRRTGIYDEVRRALGDRHVVDFGGIEPNPHYETLVKALPIIKSEGITFILAVGGGSVIDGTKFIAAAAKYEGADPWELLKNPKLAEGIGAMPFGTVLTLSATGSEMNNGAVITRAETHEKFAFRSPSTFPVFSIVDPAYTLSLPMNQVVNGVVDAFVHVMEQYMTYPADAPVQDRFAEGLLATLMELGPSLLTSPKDMRLRDNLSLSAMWALNGWIAAGVPEDWATHLIGHELTAFFGLDHGLTLAIILPHLLRDQIKYKKEKLAQFATRVLPYYMGAKKANENTLGNYRADAMEEDIRALVNAGHQDDIMFSADLAIRAIREFFFIMYGGKINLSDYGITEEQLQPIWERFEQRRWRLGENRTIDAEAVKRILLAAL
ncbi:MAG: iron-containing alcohol dehydrogenase [Bacteroides sp.]